MDIETPKSSQFILQHKVNICTKYKQDPLNIVHWRVVKNQDWNTTQCVLMMTSSNGSIFRVTGHLCGEFTGPRWIPHTKASDAELWYLLWSEPE